MATQTLDQAIRELADKETESELTICIMRQVAARLDLRDPHLLYDLYETVVFYTGNWPEEQGWGTSDTSAVVRSYVQSHPQSKE